MALGSPFIGTKDYSYICATEMRKANGLTYIVRVSFIYGHRMPDNLEVLITVASK